MNRFNIGEYLDDAKDWAIANRVTIGLVAIGIAAGLFTTAIW